MNKVLILTFITLYSSNVFACYDDGESYGKSLKQCERSAKQGDGMAQYILGKKYQNQGVFGNYKEAGKWYQKAALQGVGLAQYKLGTFYDS